MENLEWDGGFISLLSSELPGLIEYIIFCIKIFIYSTLILLLVAGP